MEKIKKSYCAGKYFSENKDSLLKQLKFFYENNVIDYEYSSRLLIVPQATFSLSGQCASNAYQYIDKKVKNVFIFGISHNQFLLSPVVPNYIEIETPFYNLYVNQQITKELVEEFGCTYATEPFENEHSCEIQFPFLQFYLNKPKIIPILINDTSKKLVEQILNKYYGNPENAFIFSADLYRGEDEKECDTSIMNTTFTLESKILNYLGTSNNTALLGLLDFITKKGYNLLRVCLTKSATDIENGKKYVGYGSFILLEEDTRLFIKEKFRKKLLDSVEFVAKRTLEGFTELDIERLLPLPEALNTIMSCFVSVEFMGKLRGCIGTAMHYQPLIFDVLKNTNMCMKDIRFEPLKLEELDRAVFKIELLGDFNRIPLEKETDIYEKIRPDIDGVLIKDGEHSALFLPSVWKNFPDKTMFIHMLKHQAGLSPDWFSPTFEAYKFTVVEIM